MPVDACLDAQQHDERDRDVDQEEPHKRTLWEVFTNVTTWNTYNKCQNNQVDYA